MNEITDHRFPGDSLNEALHIHCDVPDPTCGNASHEYTVSLHDPTGATPPDFPAQIMFQHGARDEVGSNPGVTDAAVLAVLLDRYRGFQSGPFACRENAIVITKLEEALMWMQKRVKDRFTRGVLGKNAQ